MKQSIRFIESFEKNGFTAITLPTFENYKEYIQLWEREESTMIRFMDTSGVLRCYPTDATLQVLLNTKPEWQNKPLDQPIRVCYSQVVGIMTQGIDGIKTVTQLGAEILGDASNKADCDVLNGLFEFLVAEGYSKNDLRIEIGDVSSIATLRESYDEDGHEIHKLLEKRSYAGLEQMGYEDIGKAFLQYGLWSRLKDSVESCVSKAVFNRLNDFVDEIQNRQLTTDVYIDLATTNQHHYYSGLIYRIYSISESKLLAQGGRYDGLAEKNVYACGMSIEKEVIGRRYKNEKTIENSFI